MGYGVDRLPTCLMTTIDDDSCTYVRNSHHGIYDWIVSNQQRFFVVVPAQALERCSLCDPMLATSAGS